MKINQGVRENFGYLKKNVIGDISPRRMKRNTLGVINHLFCQINFNFPNRRICFQAEKLPGNDKRNSFVSIGVVI